MARRSAATLLALACAVAAPSCADPDGDPSTLRIGHMPNLTHAQAVIARGRSRAGKGWFEEKTGLRVEWYAFKAGPAAMESMVSGRLDVAYVGPNPAINTHVRMGGAEVRVVAGATRGGACLVVRKGSGLSKPADFRGMAIGIPQRGNTQDVALRAWLTAGGLDVSAHGDASIREIENAQLLPTFLRKDIDAAWTVEPWVTRLVREAEGEVLVDESDALTTVVVARVGFAKRRGEQLKRFVEAHAELTRWIVEHPAEAKEEVAREVKALTGGTLPPGTLDAAWPRLKFEAEIGREPFDAFLAKAKSVGFLKGARTLERLVAAP